MPMINRIVYQVFMGNTEKVVPQRVIPIHIWDIQATQALTREQDGDDGFPTTTIINKEQRLQRKKTINMCYDELILNNPHNSILKRILKRRYVSSEHRQLIISKIAEFTQSMTMPNVRPIFFIRFGLFTYVSSHVMEITREEISDRAVNAAIAALGEAEDVKVVPATKSSIDKLEKVETKKMDGPCSICFEQFEDEAEEATKMPCSHVYHTNCIVKWLEYNRHVCPLCRFEMPKPIE